MEKQVAYMIHVDEKGMHDTKILQYKPDILTKQTEECQIKSNNTAGEFREYPKNRGY